MGALNLPTIASGQLQPYQTSNDADAALESGMTSALTVDLSAGNHTLTGAEFTRAVFFESTGNSVSRILTTPATNRLFAVHNGGSSALSVKTGSTILSVAAGDTAIFYTDGTTNGLVTVVASSGASGAAGGDLTGTYPNPTIAAAAVTLANMANLAANSVLGNDTGSSATPTALTMAQLKTLLALVVADVSGAAPLASPSFSGTPAAPTATLGTNTTQLSTTAFVQAAIAALTGGLIYKGTWNANTNSPTITSGSGTLGWFYKVSTAGTTTVDGISSWGVHDMLLYDGVAWDKIDGQDTEVISVAGRTGAVTLTTSDVGGLAAVASSGSAADLGTGTLPAARLSNTAVTAGSYGDGTNVGTFTVDANGRLTAAGNTAITGAAPTGSAGGDLTGTFPNPTIKSSVALAGSPTTTTQSPGDNSIKISTTAYTDAAVAAAVGGMVFKGGWNANTNTPTITSGSGTLGWFYKVTTAGTTTIDGNSSWIIGDILLYDGVAWLKIDGNSTEVTSVFGRVGAVVLALSDIPAQADGTVLANISGGSAAPLADTLTAILDYIFGSTRGMTLYRGASAWVALAAGTAGQFLQTQGTSGDPLWVSEPFDFSGFFSGLPTASASKVMVSIPIARAITFPANFAGAYMKLRGTTATASLAIDIQKNGSSIGTATIALGASSATFVSSGGSAQTLAAGDTFALVLPATADTTADNLGWVFAGTR